MKCNFTVHVLLIEHPLYMITQVITSGTDLTDILMGYSKGTQISILENQIKEPLNEVIVCRTRVDNKILPLSNSKIKFIAEKYK